MSQQILYPAPSGAELETYEWNEAYPLFASRGEAIAFAAGVLYCEYRDTDQPYVGITVVRLSDTKYEIQHDGCEVFMLDYLGPDKWQLDGIV